VVDNIFMIHESSACDWVSEVDCVTSWSVTVRVSGARGPWYVQVMLAGWQGVICWIWSNDSTAVSDGAATGVELEGDVADDPGVGPPVKSWIRTDKYR
jgi:hypothetical protein